MPELTPGIIACRDFFKNIENMYSDYLTAQGQERVNFECLFLKKGQKVRLEFEVEEEFPTMFIHKLRLNGNLFGCKLTSVDWDDLAITNIYNRLNDSIAMLEGIKAELQAHVDHPFNLGTGKL